MRQMTLTHHSDPKDTLRQDAAKRDERSVPRAIENRRKGETVDIRFENIERSTHQSCYQFPFP